MARQQRTTFIALHYDKIIVVVILITLVLSLGFLITLSNSQRKDDAVFNARLEALTPLNPNTKAVDSGVFEATMAAIEHTSPVLAEGLLVAPVRVACFACSRPIRMEAGTCPYCQAKQPTGEIGADLDSDGDGMPDKWEITYGLLPLDPRDANEDPDGDGFTNLEEYKAGTDPTDPKSHPPLIDFLRAEKIDAIRFPYVLKSKSSIGGGAYTYQLNELGRDQTYFVQVGKTVGKSEYKAISATNRMVKVTTQGIGERMREMAVLTLSNGDDEVELTEGSGPVWNSFKVTLVCDKIRNAEPIIVNQRESFTFDGERYTVVRVAKRPASEDGEVVILNESTKKEFRIPSL